MTTTTNDEASGPQAVEFEITWTVTDSFTATFTAGALWQYLDARERRLFGDDLSRLDPATVGDALVGQFSDFEDAHTYAGTGESSRRFVAVRPVTAQP